MKKNIVIYYSNNGSNQYLANKIADRLSYDIEELRPVINSHMLMIMRISLGNKRLRSNLSEYEQVILCGPIWVGKLIPPLKAFISKYRKVVKKLIFVTCCGSSFEMKDKKFGHGLVFEKAEEVYGKPLQCQAFPITLVVPEDKQDDPQLVMNTRLNDETFKGEIVDLFDRFVADLIS